VAAGRYDRQAVLSALRAAGIESPLDLTLVVAVGCFGAVWEAAPAKPG